MKSALHSKTGYRLGLQRSVVDLYVFTTVVSFYLHVSFEEEQEWQHELISLLFLRSLSMRTLPLNSATIFFLPLMAKRHSRHSQQDIHNKNTQTNAVLDVWLSFPQCGCKLLCKQWKNPPTHLPSHHTRTRSKDAHARFASPVKLC